MCGLGLAITIDSKEHINIANKINNDQSYRGPDFSKVKNFSDFSICHQRLSILDLNRRSNQPFQYKHIEIIFNGEIYNFKSLKKKLIKLGYFFSTTSDTEVIALGIHHFGESFLKKLDGMFTICWVDHIKNKIYLTADPFGIKQIYYYQDKKRFIAASELFVLRDNLIDLGYELNVDNSKLDYFLRYLSLPLYTTPYEEIKSLSNGSLLTITINSDTNILKTNLFKSFILKNFCDNINPNELSLDSVLDDSFQSDVKQAILLSGGIDSTNLAINRGFSTNDIKGYCINTNLASDGFSNDTEYAKIVSKKENIPLKVINYDTSITLEKVEDTLRRIKNVGEFSSALSLNCLLNSISNDSIKVVHSGLGADEMYGGYTLMKNFNLLQRISSLSNFFQNKTFFIGKYLAKRTHLLNPLLTKNRFKIINHLIKNNSYNFISDLITWDLEVRRDFSCNPIKISKYCDLVDFYFNYFLSSSHLPISDSISMSYSIELRVPFLSRRVFSSVYPKIYKKSYSKRILINRLQNNYSKEFLHRRKSGLGISTLTLNNDLIELLIDTLFDKYIKNRYKITKDSLVLKLKNKELVRFPYMLFSLLTFEKACSFK